MRNKLPLLLSVLMLLPLLPAQAQPISSVASPSPASQAAAGLPTDRVIIRYKTSANLQGALAPDAADRLSAQSAVAGAPLEYFREMSSGSHVLKLPGRLPLDQVELIAKRLMTLSDVEYAQPDYVLQHMLEPDDPRYTNGDQWHYNGTWGINAPAAWDITTGSNNVVVAVIDTGILNHADLSGRTVPGYDFVTDYRVANDNDPPGAPASSRDSDPSDPGDWITTAESLSGFFQGCEVHNSSWHGTHVAGTIGAASNNGVGVAGINWVSKILPVRVLGKCGGYTSDIVDGMRWAAGLSVSGAPNNSNPAKVLNMSLGGKHSCDSETQNAINAITAAGSSVIVAAGNKNEDASLHSPGNCNGVVTVAATDRDGDRAYYSNYGSVVEISAPGGETSPTSSNGVLSTLNTGTTIPGSDSYDFYQGTSMATPHVAGITSLLLSVDPSLTPAQVQQVLQNTAKPFPSGSSCNTSICGSGIVDAGRAVRSITRDVSIKTQVLGSDLKPGDRLTFTLSISNTGGVTLTNIVITDIVPTQVLVPTYTSDIPITRTGVYTYVWSAETLGIGKGGVITIYGQIDPDLPDEFGFANYASISASQDFIASNNTSSVLVGGLKVFLPVVLKNYSSAVSDWVTIASQDFEGSFPGAWQVFDNDGTTSGEYYWAQRNCRVYAGSYSGWAVGGGTNGGGLSCGSNYPNDADSWIVYGPFSLADATAGDLSFKLWLNSEQDYDGVCRMASVDGVNFYGTCTSGNTGSWLDRVLDLANVHTLGNLMGQANVWVAITFTSDYVTNYAEGGYVDNIVLRKYVSTTGLAQSTALAETSSDQVVETPVFMTLQR